MPLWALRQSVVDGADDPVPMPLALPQEAPVGAAVRAAAGDLPVTAPGRDCWVCYAGSSITSLAVMSPPRPPIWLVDPDTPLAWFPGAALDRIGVGEQIGVRIRHLLTDHPEQIAADLARPVDAYEQSSAATALWQLRRHRQLSFLDRQFAGRPDHRKYAEVVATGLVRAGLSLLESATGALDGQAGGVTIFPYPDGPDRLPRVLVRWSRSGLTRDPFSLVWARSQHVLDRMLAELLTVQGYTVRPMWPGAPAGPSLVSGEPVQETLLPAQRSARSAPSEHPAQ